MKYGLWIVERPAHPRYPFIIETKGNRHEDRTDHWLLVGLRPRDRTPLPRAGLERGRDDANAA
jgi:hypothetical protein